MWKRRDSIRDQLSGPGKGNDLGANKKTARERSFVNPTSVEFFTDALCLRVFPSMGPAITRGVNRNALDADGFVIG